MEKRAHMVVLCQIMDELLITLGQFCGHLVKGDACGIHNGQVIAEGLQEFHKTDTVRHRNFGCHTTKNSMAFFMLFVL